MRLLMLSHWNYRKDKATHTVEKINACTYIRSASLNSNAERVNMNINVHVAKAKRKRFMFPSLVVLKPEGLTGG